MPAARIEADRALTPAEAMGIRIGKTVEREDWYLGSTFDTLQSIAPLIIRKNRITLSAGDSELDAGLWHAINRDDINARHAEMFARAA